MNGSSNKYVLERDSKATTKYIGLLPTYPYSKSVIWKSGSSSCRIISTKGNSLSQ
jgi:hypothetical protein